MLMAWSQSQRLNFMLLLQNILLLMPLDHLQQQHDSLWCHPRDALSLTIVIQPGCNQAASKIYSGCGRSLS